MNFTGIFATIFPHCLVLNAGEINAKTMLRKRKSQNQREFRVDAADYKLLGQSWHAIEFVQWSGVTEVVLALVAIIAALLCMQQWRSFAIAYALWEVAVGLATVAAARLAKPVVMLACGLAKATCGACLLLIVTVCAVKGAVVHPPEGILHNLALLFAATMASYMLFSLVGMCVAWRFIIDSGETIQTSSDEGAQTDPKLPQHDEPLQPGRNSPAYVVISRE